MHILGHAKGEVELPGLTVVRSPGIAFHDPDIAEMARIADLLKAVMTLTFLPATVANNMLGNITTTGLFMSIHTASPGTTGANEIVGGTGYTGNRPAIAWAAAASGVVVSNTTQTYALLVTQSGGIPNFGLWTAATAGTYLGGGTTSGLTGSIPSGANVTFTSAVTLTVSG
jgi:hypothetical protein